MATYSIKITTLNNDFFIDDTYIAENTAKVVPPYPTFFTEDGTQGSFTEGRIVVVGGQPRDLKRLIYRPLYKDINTRDIDTTTDATKQDFPDASTHYISTDNQIVRLKGGSLLVVKQASIWDHLRAGATPPIWWNYKNMCGPSHPIVNPTGIRSHHRGALIFYRSTDGGNTWVSHSLLDIATFESGIYSNPRPVKSDCLKVTYDAAGNPTDQGVDANGEKYWTGAGFDRTEMYACPFTGNVYVTAQAIHDNNKHTGLLIMSPNGGKSWQKVKEISSWMPAVMTSTPNGRFFIFQYTDTAPHVYFTKLPIPSSGVPDLTGPHNVHYHENGVDVPPVGDPNMDMTANMNARAISRSSIDTNSSKIRVAYPALNSNQRQEARVISVEVVDQNMPPLVNPITIIKSIDSENYSVAFFSFVDPDYIDTPPGVKSNVSLFYWLEVPSTSSPSKQYAERYTLFWGGGTYGQPQYLSVQNSSPRKWDWTSNKWFGDYTASGFFWYNDTLNYLAQWTDPNGIRANIVTVQFVPILPSHPVDVNIKQIITAMLEDGGPGTKKDALIGLALTELATMGSSYESRKIIEEAGISLLEKAITAIKKESKFSN